MGCGPGRPAYEISELESSLFRELRLTSAEVDKLLNAFSEIDLDGSGMIRMDELFGSCRIEETNCNKKIFGIFDGDNSGTLNFSEFGKLFSCPCRSILICSFL
jgi:Ca2+-binding EF-hand superfamily protein